MDFAQEPSERTGRVRADGRINGDETRGGEILDRDASNI